MRRGQQHQAEPEPARQNAAIAPGHWRFARTSVQAFSSRKHQLATDLANKSQATPCVTTSPLAR